MKKNKDTRKNLEFILALAFIAISVLFRLMPHIPNFTPITAIALFGGAYLTKKTALVLPVLAMAISDFFIGFYSLGVMASVYASFVLIILLGMWLKNHKKWHVVLGGSAVSASIFFIVTNFAVWLFTPWYPKDFSGISQCYLMALPFFRNDLMGTLFYSTVFFGAYELAGLFIKKIFQKFEKNFSSKLAQ